VHVEKMTPGEYKQQARGLTIHWTVVDTPVGPALFAATDRGVCQIAFIDDIACALSELKQNWPAAQLVESRTQALPYAEEILRRMQGLTPQSRLGIVMKGSDLRLSVWLALLRVPERWFRTRNWRRYPDIPRRCAPWPLAWRKIRWRFSCLATA